MITSHKWFFSNRQDVQTFEQTQETLAVFKILALGNQQIEAGDTKKAGDLFKGLRKKYN